MRREEVLLLVPPTLREGGLALGASRARTVMTVILPTAVGGIVTATIVAVARAAGETAPLLFTCSIFVSTAITTDPRQPMATLPIVIFTTSESPSVRDQQIAWAAALVLMAVVLIRKHRRARAVTAHPTPDRASAMTHHILTQIHQMFSGPYPHESSGPRTIRQ